MSNDIIEDLKKYKEASEKQKPANPRNIRIGRSAYVYIQGKAPETLENLNVEIIEDQVDLFTQMEQSLSFHFEPLVSPFVSSEKPTKNRRATKKKYRYKKRNKK